MCRFFTLGDNISRKVSAYNEMKKYTFEKFYIYNQPQISFYLLFGRISRVLFGRIKLFV